MTPSEIAAFVLAIALWVYCGLLSYRIVRGYYRKQRWKWTIGERLDNICASLFGPISLWAAWTTYGEGKDKNANW